MTTPDTADMWARELYAARLIVEGFSAAAADEMARHGYPDGYLEDAQFLLSQDPSIERAVDDE